MAFILKRLPWLLGNGLTKTGRTIAVDTATDTVDGILETATQSEQETGTATDKIVTPGRQRYHPSAAKFWAITDAAGNIDASYNVTSISDGGAGLMTVTIATDFSSASWCALATANAGAVRYCRVDSQGAGTVRVVTHDSTPALADPTKFNVAGFGDQ